jgi:hypothetical protein
MAKKLDIPIPEVSARSPEVELWGVCFTLQGNVLPCSEGVIKH